MNHGMWSTQSRLVDQGPSIDDVAWPGTKVVFDNQYQDMGAGLVASQAAKDKARISSAKNFPVPWEV